MNKIKQKVDIIYNNLAKKDIVVAHIADLHFNINTTIKRLNGIKNYIFKINPDYLMITGDLIDEPKITKNNTKIKELLTFLTDIAKDIKVIISIGNHDVISSDDINFFNKLNDLHNIYILNNDCYLDELIYVSGFTLPNEYYYNVTRKELTSSLLKVLDNNQKLIKNIPSRLPKIALIHSPIRLTDKNVLERLKEYDLILCGHTHNGMVPDCLNFIFKDNSGIISPDKNLLPKIAKGKIVKNIGNKDITIIINGGVTKLSLRTGNILSKFNFLYNIGINKIIIRKKRG